MIRGRGFEQYMMDTWSNEDESLAEMLAMSPKLKGLCRDSYSVFFDDEDLISTDDIFLTPKQSSMENQKIYIIDQKSETMDSCLVETRSLSSFNSHIEVKNDHQQWNHSEFLYHSLKERFNGRKGNTNLITLIDLAMSNGFIDGYGPEQSIMTRELKNLLNFAVNRNMRIKSYSQFDLLRILKSNNYDCEIQQIISEIEHQHTEFDFKGFNKLTAIKRYLSKKNKRRISKSIKYEVRSDFAINRPRVNGKFLGKPRIDINQIVKNISA